MGAVDVVLLAGGKMAVNAGDMSVPHLLLIDDETPMTFVDSVDAFVFHDDDPAVLSHVIESVLAKPGLQVRDFSDGSAQMINALSSEAARLAESLALLARSQQTESENRPIEAAMVRRLIKVRQDRSRFFPADIFADPAWDMLLDLAAAQLEGKMVPVSSLCIAANVPTTTALRWVRSLIEAGFLERRTDPADARRSWISLSSQASDAIMRWLRGFAAAFASR